MILQFLASSSGFTEFVRDALRLEGIEDIRIVALPVALVCSGILQAGLLLFFLKKKVGDGILGNILPTVGKICISTVALSFVVYIITYLYGTIFSLRTLGELLGQLVLAAGGGIATYFVTAWALHCPELGNIFGSLKKQFLKENYG